jgi:hypothetical protein
MPLFNSFILQSNRPPVSVIERTWHIVGDEKNNQQP